METCEFTPVRVVATEEDDRLNDLEKAIKTFVRLTAPVPTCDPLEFPQIHLTLSVMETRAFLNTYERETSFRSDYSASVRLLFTVYSRVCSETQACRQRQHTTYLWQEHAAALKYLLGRAKQALGSSHDVQQRAFIRGMATHVMELDICRSRLADAVAGGETLSQEQLANPPETDTAFSYLPEETFIDDSWAITRQ